MKTNLKDQYITRWDPLYSYKYHLIMLKTAKILFFLFFKFLLLLFYRFMWIEET